MNTFKKDSQNEPKPKAHNSVLRLVSIYAALSVIWILLSDKVVESLFADQATAIAASTLKGWGFVAATSLLLYILMRRLTNQILTFAQREQEILRTSKERFRNLFEKNTSVMLLVDPITGEIVDVNASATAYHGYSKAQLTGMRINDLNTLPQEQIAAQMQRASNGESNLFIFTHRLASGEVRDVEVHTSPIEWEGRSLLLGSVHDITERKQAEEKINQLAFYDQLTGLLNRTLLQDRLRQAMAASARSGFQSALLLIDLDNFKTLNDTHGHDMGDILLQRVAQRLTECVRESDTVARLGGDEFVVMLVDLSKDQSEAAVQAELVGRKILATISQNYQLREITYRITPSIGACLFCGHNIDPDMLLKQSDLAMYKAKDAGRNNLCFFEPDMELVVLNLAKLEGELREAIEKGQFLIHYQPQVVENKTLGAEALVRWLHPERGIVSPAEFIPLAEETGLILPVGQWVLKTACTQLALWANRPEMAHLTIAINVSARQFRQEDFVEQVLSALKKTGANPAQLKLELTESLLVSHVDDLIEKMFALKAEGVGFSLDDFGTGYSSLSYLKRMPLDQLKIDQSFVRDVLSDPNDASIAKTIIALAENLGLSVIAEGVETALQRDFLASAGCHAYQGYFFSRPLPIEAFEAFVLQK